MASKRGLRRKLERECDRKRRFFTREAAERARDIMLKYPTSRSDGVDIYYCPKGGHYHIGHKRGSGPVARSRALTPKNQGA